MCPSKGLDVAQTSFATKLSHKLIEEHLTLVEDFRERYANLPNGDSFFLHSIIEKLDQTSNPSPLQTDPIP